MKKNLTKTENVIYYFVDGKKVMGVHSHIRGDMSYISGDMSGISGDMSGIRGDVSGIRGDVSGIRGDIDTCDISEEEREKGIDIRDLIK